MRYFLLIINFLLLLTVLGWPLMFFGSMFMFDSPGSSENLITRLLFMTSVFYPIPVLLGFVGAVYNMKVARLRNLKRFTLVTASPILFACVLLALLDVFCASNFACR